MYIVHVCTMNLMSLLIDLKVEIMSNGRVMHIICTCIITDVKEFLVFDSFL